LREEGRAAQEEISLSGAGRASRASPPSPSAYLQADHRAALLDRLHGVLDLGVWWRRRERGGERRERRERG